MQALIDFDGWRKWKDFSQTDNKKKEDDKKGKLGANTGASKEGKRKSNRTSMGNAAGIMEEAGKAVIAASG